MEKTRPRINKTCSCGIVHIAVPATAKYHNDDEGYLTGWFWNCACHSTLFWPATRVVEEKKAA